METQLREAIGAHEHWYHTLELAPGLVTDGWFDLRPIVGRLPFPDLSGKRCLDIATFDGFFAFEMERRGASEVVATDLTNPEDLDWPPAMRADPARMRGLAGPPGGQGFRLAAQALSSSVERCEISVYDLSPESVGTFDFVFCGSLLLHLRDPMRALAAIRSVCTGHFLSNETIDLDLSVLHRRTPLARFNGKSMIQWFVPNRAAHVRMVDAAGFKIVQSIRPYSVPLGPRHPPLGSGAKLLRRRVMARALTGGFGIPHSAVLTEIV